MIPWGGAVARSGADGWAVIRGMPVGGIRRKGICGHRPPKGSLLKYPTHSGGSRFFSGWKSVCAAAWRWDRLQEAGHFPQGFVAPQSKVSTFSFVAPCLVEEILAALPARVLEQAPEGRTRRVQSPTVTVRLPV